MKKAFKNIIKYSFLILFIFVCTSMFSEDILPSGYGAVKLGMSMEEAKQLLSQNPAYWYRGERDVSLLPGENRTLISTKGMLFLDECWFQFDNDRLYIITINLNTEQIDYYSVFSTLCEKYGQPNSLSPKKSEWKNDSVMMSLEKPLTLKYTDVKIFEELQNKSNVRESAEEYNRKNFLDSL